MNVDPQQRISNHAYTFVRFCGFLLPVLAFVIAPQLAEALVGNQGSVEWLNALLMLSAVIAAVGGLVGGRLALIGCLVGFFGRWLSVGSLSGEGGMWYLIFVPCLLVMLATAGMAAALSRKWNVR